VSAPTGPQPGHEEYDALAAGWALHALEPDDEALFADHLAECPVCPRAVAELEATLGELAVAAPATDPPAGLFARIAAAAAAPDEHPAWDRHAAGPPATIDLTTDAPSNGSSGGWDTARPVAGAWDTPRQATPLPADRRSRPDRARRPRPTPVPEEQDAALGPGAGGAHREPRSRAGAALPLRTRRAARSGTGTASRWLAAAAAVAVLVLGGWNVLLQRDVREARQTATQAQQLSAQREALVRELVQPGTRSAEVQDPARRTLAYVLVREGQVQVVADGLDRNDPSRTSYWLWAVRGTQGPQPIGLFDVERALDRATLGTLPAELRSATAFAVSIEPGRGRPTKPTTPLGQGQLRA